MQLKKYVLAHLTLRRELYAAAAERKLPDAEAAETLAAVLAPFCEEVEASARSEIETREAALAALRKEINAERAQRQRERCAYESALERARHDVVTIAEQQQLNPLEDVSGFYVYYLWGRDGVLLYVGLSTNIYARLGDHMSNPRRRPHIGRISVTRCPDSDTMTRLELLAIREHAPAWNIAGVV